MARNSGAYSSKAFSRAVALSFSAVSTTRSMVFGFIPPTSSPPTSVPQRPLTPSIRSDSPSIRIHATTNDIQVGTCCLAGTDTDRPQKVNQDAYFSTTFIDENENEYLCAGVMDGHGLKGHVVTEFLAKELPSCIQEQLHNPQRLLEWEEKVTKLGNYQQPRQDNGEQHRHHQTLINAFHQAHVNAMENPKVPAGRSGTTCITCLMDNDDIHVAYVGDSRGIRVSLSDDQDEAATASSRSIQVLATETTVQNMPTERARIEACQQEEEGVRIDANGNVWYGPVAIAMTRALGDAVMLRAGVLPTPVVQTFSRSTADAASLIIIATDGIWDVLSNEQVSDIAQNALASTGSVDEVASILSQTARKKWNGDEDLPLMDEKIDDIACVCIHC